MHCTSKLVWATMISGSQALGEATHCIKDFAMGVHMNPFKLSHSTGQLAKVKAVADICSCYKNGDITQSLQPV